MPGTWNLRTMPSRLIACGGRWVISSPRNHTVPEVGEKAPVMTLKSVVLPHPLGPMMQRSSPAPSDRVTPRKTRRPPKSLVTSRTWTSGRVTGRRQTVRRRSAATPPSPPGPGGEVRGCGRPWLTPGRRRGVRRTPSRLALVGRLDQPQILQQRLLLAPRLGDDDVEIRVTVFLAQAHHPVAGLEREAGHRVDDLLFIHRAGPPDALDEEAGQHVVSVHRIAHDGAVAKALPDLGHEGPGLGLVERADKVG